MPDISRAEMIAAVNGATAYAEYEVDYWRKHPESPAYLTASAKLKALRAVLAHLERTQWRPIEEAPESVKDLARAAEESPGARLRFGFGFEIGPPMQAPCYAFWLNDKGYVTTFFALPPSPETPR